MNYSPARNYHSEKRLEVPLRSPAGLFISLNYLDEARGRVSILSSERHLMYNLPVGQEPHYSRYIKFIDRCKNRPYPEGVYGERHHILPRSMGGRGTEELKLTGQEHLIAHMILAYCYGGKMWYAFWAMCNMSPSDKRYTNLSFTELARLREEVAKLVSESTKRSWKDNREERLAKCRAFEETKVCKEAHVRQGTTLKLRYASDPVLRKLCSDNNSGENNVMFGQTHTPEVCDILSKSVSERLSNSRWMNNGKENRLILKEEQDLLLAQGFIYGRLNQPITTPKGSRLMNKGGTSKSVKLEDQESFLSDGWKFGRIHVVEHDRDSKGKFTRSKYA